MNSKKGRFCCIMPLCICMLVAGCAARVLPSVQPTETGKSAPAFETAILPTATAAPTAKLESMITDTLKPTLTPTQVVTVVPTMGSRVWNQQQLDVFMSNVGAWFLAPGREPPVPREGDSIAQLLDRLHYDGITGRWTGPVEAMELDPDTVCAWAFKKLREGYSLTIIIDGELFQNVTREERWLQFSFTLGDQTREPYCSEFDISKPVLLY